MPSIGDITGTIKIIDKGSPAVAQFESNLKGSIRTIEVAGGRLTATLEGMLSKAALLATAGAVARAGFQFLKESGQEAIEAERAFAQLRAGVESTGGAAGKSAEELSALAGELSKLTGFDDELIAGGEAILLTFRRVRGEAFDQTMRLALDLSARFGKDIDSSVVMIAKALDMLMAGSAKGLSALSKAGVTFTDQQKKMMEQLVLTGRAAEAEKLFFKELEAQFGGSAVAARDTLGGALQALGVAWSNLKENIGTSGSGIRIVIEGLIELVDSWADAWLRVDLGATQALGDIIGLLGKVEISTKIAIESLSRLSMKGTVANPFASDEQKARAIQGYLKAQADRTSAEVKYGRAALSISAEINQKVQALIGNLPRVKSGYQDIGEEIATVGSRQRSWLDDLQVGLARQVQALDLLRQGMPIDDIERLVEVAEQLGKTNLFDPLVLKAAAIKTKIDEITTAFELADQAKKKFADAGDNLDELIKRQFETVGGDSDPQMQKLIESLREAGTLIGSVKTGEERRLETVARAVQLYEQFNGKVITHEQLQQILLANADQWNVELDATQVKFNEIYEELSYIAEGIAYDLVYNWRRAWEENESIVDATVESLRDSFLNVLQDIISQWLSAWFRAMAAWLARWIATQKAGQAATGQFSFGVGSSGTNWAGAASGASSAGVSANALAGWASAAFALYVVYKGFIEDHKRKFARVEIIDGQSQVTAWHGRKYMAGVQSAAESIISNVAKFLDEINVTMERLGTVIVESSKSGFNISMGATSTGKLFKSMEEAVSYAQVLMLKYGEFSDSVSLLVRSVIQSTKAITIEDLASDIAFAKELETQNLEDSALAIQRAMDLAIAQWKRAEDLFLSFYDTNLPAFAEAAESILARLSTSLWANYNRLAGIEEDPEKAWQRQKAAQNAQRSLVLAQLKLWGLEIDARIKNFRANTLWLGGLGGVTQGTLKFVAAMLSTAEAIDPALQQLIDIQKLINETINQIPPELTDADYPGKQGRGRGGRGQDRKQLAEDLRDEIAALEAEARGSLYAAFYELNRNIAAFRERAKEAKLPTEELARGIELLTRQFQASIRAQAEGFAGLGTDFTRKIREIGDFFDQLRELGRRQTGIPNWLVNLLEGKALDQLGAELDLALAQFSGLVDPMLAINAQAETLRQNVIAYGQAVGWSAEQIDAALNQIEQGISFQRQQGVNSLLDRLFAYAKEAGLYQEEAIAFEREKALLDLQILEAQFAFYNALTAQVQDMIGRLREFVNSEQFNRDLSQRSDEVVSVRVVEDEADIFTELFDNIIAAVEDWRSAIDDFAKSTQDLLTNEALTGLTQQEQLDFARSRAEELIARAQTGDLEALRQLDSARREFLEELRESEAGGFGFDVGFDWIMNATAGLLANAQQGEQNLIADMLEGWEIPIHRMPDLLEDLNTTMYDGIAQIVDAIYEAIRGVPSFASGGIVMSGPRLVRVAEYVPEAIVPLDRLANMVPYRIQQPSIHHSNGAPSYASENFRERHMLSRLSAVEESNNRIAQSLTSIKNDMSKMSRKR